MSGTYSRKLMSSSRIPSPSRTPASYTRRGSQASTPQRSRSSSQSPTRGGGVSPACSSRSLENLSPIRPLNVHKSRSSEIPPGDGSGKNLVRYITLDMIRKLAKEDQLEHIQQIAFNLSGEKKIRYIENLEGLKNLAILNLNGNIIQRIEKLDRLTNLRQLHLADNKIEKIECLESLVNLQLLNLENNMIERIPLWLVKKLRCLQVVMLAHNNISSLTDVVRLRGLHDLHSLTIAGNPLCELPHHRPYIIFHLRVLNHLDEALVKSSERSDAAKRFSLEELDRLSRDLQNTTNQLLQTQELHNKSLEELELLNSREREMEEKERIGIESREELERELDAKDEMLKRKAKELQRAQAKHYQLEQELAFMKLDVKFQPLDLPPGDGLSEDDSPYLGKARFKRNEFATEGNIPNKKQQFKIMEDQSRRNLDEQLSEKQRQLNEAAERLTALQRELRETQNQVFDASRELNKLEQDRTARKLSEADKQKIRQKLAAKIRKINQMREDAEELESSLSHSRRLIPGMRSDQDDLRSRIASLDPNSPEYGHALTEMRSKEAQFHDLTREIEENDAALERLLKNIAVDTDAIKELEDQLEKGTSSPDESLRHELEEIVRGLQDYLVNVRRKADAQRAEFDELLRDKERLVRKLAAMEQEKSIMMTDADDYTQLQQQLDALSKSMTEMQDMNSSLQAEATHLTKHDAELQAQLQEAQKKVDSLQQSMQESDRKNQSDRDKLNKQMEEMAKLQNKIGDRESEAAALKKEVGKLKDHNHELSSTAKQYKKEISHLLQPHEVAQRLAHLGDALKNGDRSALKLSRDGGPFQNALKELGTVLFDLLDKENKDKAKAEKALQALENHVGNLKKKLVEAQREYKDTMEAVTEAKIEAEKKKHENALRCLDDEIMQLRDRLQQAEDDADLLRALAENERKNKEEEMREKEIRARLYDAQSQATIRDLERELGVTRRGVRDKEEAVKKELGENRAKVEALHKKLKKLEEERENNLMETMDAEATAAKALEDLANAEEEISALEDLLKEHERDPSGGRGRSTMRRLRGSLADRQDEVDRLRKVLRGRKLTPEQIDNLMEDLAALRDALSSNHQNIKNLWPGYYYFLPGGGKWVFNGSRNPPVGPPPIPPPGVLQGVAIDSSHGGVQPGTPGMITSQEDGSLMFVPFDGFFCNVPEHHDLEDEVSALQEALERSKEKRKACKLEMGEMMKLVGPLEEGEGRLDELKEMIKSHEEMIRKLKEDEDMMAKEKAETVKELADLKDTLTHKLQSKHHLEEKVGVLLGELRTEEALIERNEMLDELRSLERTLSKRRADLRDADRMLREAREGAEQQEEKTESMTLRYEKARNELNEAEQDAEEIERQARDTGGKLVRARGELRQLQNQVKDGEARRIQLDDQCRQLARLVTNKEAEFTALEQKTDHMTAGLERLQSELILTEEKEAERLAALRESEKVLSERREEIGKLKDQGMLQRDEVEGLDRMLGKKKTELQLLQENIEQHQSELTNVLKEGKADVQEKQKQIKQLRRDVDDLTSSKSDLEAQISRRRSELVCVREDLETANEELQNKISELNRQKSELKHVLEMLGLEQQELDSLKRQHESKSSELADTQHKLLEERTEYERMLSDVQRKQSELSKVKQNVEKLRSDVDCLTSQRSTLEETVTSLMKEKEMLSSTAAALEDKIQTGKKNLYDIRSGIEKSSLTLDEIEQELSESKKEVHGSNLMKSTLNKEISTLSSTSKDLKCELASYRSELQDVQEQLQILDQDLRAVSKQRDEVAMEVISFREEAKTRGHELELLNQQLKRKREEVERIEDAAREKREELSGKERDIDRLSRDIERQEEKLSRTVAELNSDIQRLQRELAEQRDELESTVIKRDAVKRDMERLGRLDGKFEDTESQIRSLESKLTEKERELHATQRDRAELKGALSSVENELRAFQVETDHESRKLKEKVEDLKQELERTRTRAEEEISSLEKMSEDHCARASRFSNEVNQLRADHVRLKKEIRFLEEEHEKEKVLLQASARRLRDEIDDKVEMGVSLLDSSHSEAVEDMKDLLQLRESNEKKMNALKEIQRSRSPPRSYPIRRDDRTMISLQEDLKAKQDEIASQIRRQMNRHREQWQARKLQSEGKLKSLRKKVDTLDELVSNTSLDSLSRSRDREGSPMRHLPTLEERENMSPPEKDFI